MPLVSRLGAGELWISLRRNSADSTAGSQASTLVCHTCGWDPRSGIYGVATGPNNTCLNTWIVFSKCLVEIEIATGDTSIVPNRLPVPWTVWGYVMRDLKALAGPGPAGFPLPLPSRSSYKCGS